MPPRTALLVIDMQESFSSMTKTALPNVLQLCDYFTRTSWPVIFTQHGHTKAELTANSTNQLVRKWGISGSIAVGSDEWNIVSSLHKFLPDAASPAKGIPLGSSLPEPDSDNFPKIVPKNTYDAFINTCLSRVLESVNVKRVVVCGVMTDCCCDTTARAAFNRGYETWLVSDACGSANRNQHEAGLRGFGFAFGEVLTTEDVVGRLRDGE